MLSQVTALLGSAGAGPDDAGRNLAGVLLRTRLLALRHLIELGDDMPHAIAIGEALTADLERLLGADHPSTLASRDSLASAYQATGRPAEAIPLFEENVVT